MTYMYTPNLNFKMRCLTGSPCLYFTTIFALGMGWGGGGGGWGSARHSVTDAYPRGGYLGFQVTGMIEGFFWV